MRKYDTEYKVQAVKLAKKIDSKKACEEIDLPIAILSGWIRATKDGKLDLRT